MADHDIQLLKDASGPRRAYDNNGNFYQQWYLQQTKCFDFYKDHYEKEFRLYVYEDGSYQLTTLWQREILFGSW
jgi:hypothetical protein